MRVRVDPVFLSAAERRAQAEQTRAAVVCHSCTCTGGMRVDLLTGFPAGAMRFDSDRKERLP